MSAGSGYLETCAETLQQIDSSELYNLAPGQTRGSGTQFYFRSIGKLRSIDQYIGVKLPKDGRLSSAEIRLAAEVAQIAMHTEAAPELMSHVPTFSGMMSLTTPWRLMRVAGKCFWILCLPLCASIYLASTATNLFRSISIERSKPSLI